ncbi:hypothetical protein CCACVL1_23697 [Corchorus capsularis]|uniref:Uncharacterized protein n=1 Tax=Corchorus capsularis TaxID=210143 RepID=A0A1R3GSV0_COCAP|nr:hypothetical protein CCACVL1_23697 [Corchorus capsularis]
MELRVVDRRHHKLGLHQLVPMSPGPLHT